jgi:hypothetical protein
MSLARGDEALQISTRKSRLRPSEFLTPSAKRLLQHNQGKTGSSRPTTKMTRSMRWMAPTLRHLSRLFTGRLERKTLGCFAAAVQASMPQRGSPTNVAGGTFPSGYRRDGFPISEVIEPGPFVDRSAAPAAKVAAVLPRQLFLAGRINRRAVRTGEIGDHARLARRQNGPGQIISGISPNVAVASVWTCRSCPS